MTNTQLILFAALLVTIASFFTGMDDELNRQEQKHRDEVMKQYEKLLNN